ncbi:MAG: S1C family serine protease, partial [Oscillospiraceae bacterium]
NENHSRKDNSAEVTYYPEEKCPVKNGKKNTFLKAAAYILGAAFISVMSIAVSDVIRSEKDSIQTATETVVSRPEEQAVEADIKADNVSDYKSILEISGGEDTLTVPEIVKKVKPSVVGISSEFSGAAVSTGTGIIMSDDGYIVTNAHVVQNTENGITERAGSVTAVLSDSSECKAEIIGADSRTDLAVIKINPDGLDLTPAEFGDSDSLLEGELAIAIGNPLGFELYGSTTCGIISALNRKITVGEYEMNLIQTDAAINPGNSGGPLLNGKGQVIGINSSKIISDYAEGIGFAIPISSAKGIIDDLIENGYVTGRPMIGISGENIGEKTAKYYNLPQGVCVRFITPDSAADVSGIEIGDIIIALNGESVFTMEELNKRLDDLSAGDTVNLTVYRRDTDTQFELPLVLDENKT